MGVSDSLSSSTDTLDDPAASPNKPSPNAFGSTIVQNYTRSPGRSVPHSNTTHNIARIDDSSATETNSNESQPSYERVQSADCSDSRIAGLSVETSGPKEFLSDVSLKSCSSSDNEPAYTTIKRSPKTSSDHNRNSTASPVKQESNGNVNLAATTKTEVENDQNESFTDAEASDFMKQLRQRRRTLNAVDKSSLPFWDKHQEKCNSDNSTS